MAKGGKRAGAGRKPGVPNKASAERQAAIAASGLTPLEYMLSVCRDENAEQAIRLKAANDAAPYVHPRLSTVNHQGSGENGALLVQVVEYTKEGE